MMKKSQWTGLLRMLRPYLGRELLLIGSAVAQALAQVGLAVATKYVVDAAVEKNGQLPLWGAVLLGILLFIVGNYAFNNWFSGSTSDRCMARMRHSLLAAAAYSKEEDLQRYHSGELLSRGMEDVRTVCDGMVGVLPGVAGQITRLVGSFASVIIMYPPIAPLLLLAGTAIVLISACTRPVMKRHHARVRKAEDQVLALMQEDLQQLELVQSLQVEPQVLERFQVGLNKSLSAKGRRRRWSVTSNAFISGVSQLGTGALLLWGATQVAAGALSYGSLSAMLQLLALFRGPVLGISGQVTRLSAIEVAAERLGELLKTAPQSQRADTEGLRIKAVVFENVTFSYPGDEASVLKNFNASFPLENWACLTGISGKGKSTLFKLMLGLYAPQKGRVYLQTDRGELPCGKQTRHLFAYVPQDYALFSGTIRENLLLVAPDASEESLENALRIAQAEYVRELTQGDRTQVRENNTGLSKGQLQRLAIARAVLMERPVFLLDECTSALDAQTEAAVLANLQKMGKQAILVTHRPEAVEKLETVAFVSMEQ